MNTLKRAALAAIVLAGLALAGCASDSETRRAEAMAQTRASELAIERAKADAEESKAVARLADKIDAGGATAYLVAKVLGRPQAPTQVIQQAPQSFFGLAWQSALQVADLALRGYGIKAQRDTSIASTNAQRDTAIASYGAFTTMGSAIATAGTAGYQYVQAPAANVTTTLSGTGVIGSGTYTGPVTTTRTCNGGTGAAGGNGAGTTTGGAGGVGGAAPGGTC